MMNSKMMASGGMMKSKMMASGGKTPATKKALAEHAAKPASKAHAGLKAGGMMKKGYASGGMPMVMKDGKKVPSFAADGKGKMKMGGSVAPSKMGKVKTGSGMDGLSRVKTKGAMPKMARGGKT
jgi:hypothetical protein